MYWQTVYYQYHAQFSTINHFAIYPHSYAWLCCKLCKHSTQPIGVPQAFYKILQALAINFPKDITNRPVLADLKNQLCRGKNGKIGYSIQKLVVAKVKDYSSTWLIWLVWRFWNPCITYDIYQGTYVVCTTTRTLYVYWDSCNGCMAALEVS